MPASVEQPPVADQHHCAGDLGGDAAAERVGEGRRLEQRNPARLGRLRRRRAPAGARSAARRRRQAAAARAGRCPVRRAPTCTRGSPKVSVPVLSSTTVSTRPSVSRWMPPLTMAPRRAARPMAPRMASGVPAAMPQAPATMITEMVSRTSRGDQVGDDGGGEGEIDEIAGEPVGEPLDGRARPLGALDRLDDPAVAGVAAHPLDHDLEAPSWLIEPA